MKGISCREGLKWIRFRGKEFRSIVRMGLDFDPKDFDEWTSLEETVACVQDPNRFLELKKSKVYEKMPGGKGFNKGEQLRIYDDLRNLLIKVASADFEEGDYECLMKYLNQDSGARYLGSLEADYSQTAYFPFNPPVGDLVAIISIPIEDYDYESEKVCVTLKHIDEEITKRLFYHIWLIMIGREKIRICSAEGCSEPFIARRKLQRFHSPSCRNKQNLRNSRRRRKEKLT